MRLITLATIISLTLAPAVAFSATARSQAVAQQSQGQVQYQSQSQGQNQVQSAIASPKQSQSLTETVTYSPSNSIKVEKTEPVIENSFNSKSQRSLPYLDAPIVNTTGGPAAFWNPNDNRPGPNFVSTSILVPMLNAVDPDEVQVAEADDIEVSMQKLAIAEPAVSKVQFSIGSAKTQYNCKPVAVISLTSNGKKVNSAALAVKLAKLAKSVGGTKIVFINEGEIVQLETEGWGVGFNQSAAYTGTTSGSMGGVSAGGTGYSSGKARFVRLPWLTAVILR